MKWVRIKNGIVQEIIPTEATIPSVMHWYGAEFAAQCSEASDEVLQGWVYNAAAGTFSAPPEPGTTAAERITALKQQLADTDYQIIKCAECSLAGLDAPYDIAALHTARQALRDEINALEAAL